MKPPGKIVVGFAGFGGMCQAFKKALKVSPYVAVNHWEHAIKLHTLNHPETHHYQEDVHEVDIVAALEGHQAWWIHVSPDCTHHSKAKGGQPRDQKIRGLAWILVEWARQTSAQVLSLENVIELLSWGPLDEDGQPIKERAGEDFQLFCQALRDLGYAIEWRELDSADFGAATRRKRLFMMMRRDGQPIIWPTPTHGPGRIPYQTFRGCVDWSVETPSIFGRKKDLADSTCRRVAKGLMRFARPTLTTPDILAWVGKHYTGVTGHHLDRPIGTITATDHHSLCTAELGSPEDPRAQVVGAFISSFYSGGGTASSIDCPLPTIVATARHALVVLRGEGKAVVDIGFRMLTPRELARAQGFDDSYQLTGTVAQQIRCIGNAVVPQVAEALIRANAPQPLVSAA